MVAAAVRVTALVAHFETVAAGCGIAAAAH